MSTTGTKVPAIIDIPADIDPKIKRVLDSLKEASEVRLGRRGDPRDRAITLRELVDSGLAIELKDEPFNPNAGTGTTDFALPTFLQPDPSAPVPPTPTGLSAGAAFTTITLSWDDPQISNLAFTEIWRNGSDNLSSATRVDTVSANVWSDTVDTAQTFYYWVRHVNTNSVTGTFSSSVNATTAQVNAARIENAVIDNTKLVNKTLTNAKIADGTITSDILAANSVIAGKIATNAIVANDGVIGNAAILTAQIDDLAVTGAKIANLAVDAAKMANATITSAKIGSLEVKSSNIDNLAITTGKIANAAITNAKINDLNASKITAGSLSANRIAANSLNIASKGELGSAGNIKSGTGQIQQTTNSTGAVNQFYGGSSSLLTTFAASSPFHKSGSTSLGEIASVSFSTPSNTATYNFLGFHGVTGFFSGDEEKLIVISIQNSNGTVIADAFQYVNFSQATDIFGIALTQSLSGGNNFVARLYAGTKDVTTSGGIIRFTGTIMAFGLGL